MVKKVTINDVARVSGVAKGTVSSVLNGREKQARISQKTCERVKEVAKRLRYVRDDVARSMRTGNTNTIGFACYTSRSEFLAGILSGVMERASELDYNVKLFPMNKKHMEEIANRIIQRRLDGTIIYGAQHADEEELRHKLLAENILTTVVSNSRPFSKGIHVTSNEKQGAYVVVEHLYKLGHRKIAFMTYTEKKGGPAHVNRRKAFTEALAEFNLTIATDHYIEIGDIDIQRRIVEVLSSHERPEAFVCTSDILAMNVLDTAKSIGVRVPENLSITGYSNMYFSRHTRPRLTTVNEPHGLMGRKAAESLISAINDHDRKSFKELIKVELDMELVIRDTTGPKPEI